MIFKVNLSQEEVFNLETAFRRYHDLIREEQEGKGAPAELLDLEDAFGDYFWLLERLLAAKHA